MPDGGVRVQPISKTLTAPINGDAGIAVVDQGFCGAAIFFYKFRPAGKDKNRPFAIGTGPMADANAHTVRCGEPMGNALAGAAGDIIV